MRTTSGQSHASGDTHASEAVGRARSSCVQLWHALIWTLPAFLTWLQRVCCWVMLRFCPFTWPKFCRTSPPAMVLNAKLAEMTQLTSTLICWLEICSEKHNSPLNSSGPMIRQLSTYRWVTPEMAPGSFWKKRVSSHGKAAEFLPSLHFPACLPVCRTGTPSTIPVPLPYQALRELRYHMELSFGDYCGLVLVFFTAYMFQDPL